MTSSRSASPTVASGSPQAFRWPPQWSWLGLFAVALLFFGVQLAHEPLWLDETYSFAMTERSYLDVLRWTTRDVHPPLYYLILKFFMDTLGDTPFVVRLPSLLSAAAFVALGAGPVRRVWNARTGWIFASLALLSSGILCFAQEARMYSLAILLVTGAALYGHLAVREGRRSDLICLGVFTWAASLTHYFALVAVGMNALFLICESLLRARQRIRGLALTLLLAAVGFLPWVPFFFAQMTAVTKGFWIPPTSLELVIFGLLAPFSYKYEDIPAPWQAAVTFALTVSIVAVTLLSKRWRGNRTEVSASVQLLAVFSLTLLFSLAFSFLVRPIYMPRYMIVCAGLFLAVLAAGLARLPGKAAWAATAVLIGLGLPAWLRVQTQVFNGPFLLLAQEVQKAQPAQVALVHNGFPFSFSLFPSAHAVTQARHLVLAPQGSQFDPSGGGLYAARGVEVIESLKELNAVQQIWIVDSIPGADPVDVTELESSTQWKRLGDDVQLEEPWSWVKLRIKRFESNSTRIEAAGE